MFTEEELIQMEYVLYPQRAGEYELKRYLRDNGYKVEDVTNEPTYWKKDIDLIVNGAETIEVKWDTKLNNTGNLFIETKSDVNKGNIGWYYFCQANKLYYGDAQNKLFYIFDFAQLKEHIEAHKEEYKVRQAADYTKDGIKKWSEGYLVPIETLTNLYTTVSVYGY